MAVGRLIDNKMDPPKMKNALAIFAILSNGIMASSDAALELVEETVAKINCVDELTPEYVDDEICNNHQLHRRQISINIEKENCNY